MFRNGAQNFAYAGQKFKELLTISGDLPHLFHVASAQTIDARSQHVRAFEQILRTLRPLTAEELGASTSQSGNPTAGPLDGGVPDAGAAGSASFESAPAPKVNPVGPCAK